MTGGGGSRGGIPVYRSEAVGMVSVIYSRSRSVCLSCGEQEMTDGNDAKV